MINTYQTSNIDITLIEPVLADSHGGSIEDMRKLMSTPGSMVASFFDENTILAILGVTPPDEAGVCEMCTLYSTNMFEMPIKCVKAARSVVNTLMSNSNVKGLRYAIPSSSPTGPQFSSIMGFRKVNEIGEYDIYYRGE